MRLRFMHRTCALMMAMLTLFCSTGFSMDMHFCQGRFQGINLLGQAKSCHGEKNTPKCHQEKKSSCCHNETIVYDTPDMDKTQAKALIKKQLSIDIATSQHSFYAVYPIAFCDLCVYPFYQMILVDRDMQILYQTLLI